MGNRINWPRKGKTRCSQILVVWLQQLVAEKTIKLVKVKGTQHPPDVGTISTWGSRIEDSEGVRDKLTVSQSGNQPTIIGIASIGIASLLSGREPE
eukprot:3410065-Amphidinium_carterae.2